MLYAYERGCDPIITIDDDNFLIGADFVGRHSIVGRSGQYPAVVGDGGWADVCDGLLEKTGTRFFHRGFPPAQRSPGLSQRSGAASGRIVVNAGLWLGDPDIDAVQRLARPVEVTEYRGPDTFVLGAGTWSPFNSQNTSLARDVVPAYFLSPLIGRYDDIWASYVINAIAHHLGDLIAYGEPVVRQDRNVHNYWRDLDLERPAMSVTDRLCERLRQIELTRTDYLGCLNEIVEGLRRWAEVSGELQDAEQSLVAGFVDGLAVWSATMESAGQRERG